MAPPKKAQRDAHAAAAALFGEGVVDTATSLGCLVQRIAARKATPGMSDEARQQAEEAVKKAIQRAYPDSRNRLAQLWDGVVARAELPTGQIDFISVPVDVLGRIKGELRVRDPLFSEFTAVMAGVEAAAVAGDRILLLRGAAGLLRELAPAAEPPIDDVDLQQHSGRFSRLSGAWASVFEAAITGSGAISADAAEIAEEAIVTGYEALRKSRAFRDGISFSRPSECRWGVDTFAPDPWVSDAAVLGVRRGVGADELFEHTRSWVVERLDIALDRVSAGEVLAQAAQTLMRFGGRAAVKEALEAAWDTGDTNGCWETLLDLSISLAAVMYGHADPGSAAAVLTPAVRNWLEGEYPGDPDEGWGSSVDYRLYSLVTRALNDPIEVLGDLRWAWVEEIGEGGYRRSLWVLTAMLVQTTLQIGQTVEAARLARLAPRMLDAPGSEVDRQVADHVREMATTNSPAFTPPPTERIDELLGELIQMVVLCPDAVELAQCQVFEGLARVATAARRGSRIRGSLSA